MERRLRIAAVVLVLAWFFVPPLRHNVPAWIPFLAYAALEAQFLVGGLREHGAPRPKRGRAPQDADIEDFGGPEWLEPELVEVGGSQIWIPAELDEEPPRRERPSGGWLPRLELGLAVAIVLAVLAFVVIPDSGWSSLSEPEQTRTEERLSAEAARIAGHGAEIHCDARGEAVGVVQHADGIAEVGGVNAYLTPAICFRLHQLAFEGDAGPFSQTAHAIAVLAHEAWHLNGVRNEGVANCRAFQSGVELGERLGLSHGTALRMMRQQYAENAIQARSAPAYLVPPGCKRP